MTYPLAKELKDAGFYQGLGSYIHIEGDILETVRLPMHPEYAYIPTLSELIEACEGEFLSLARFGSTWQAFRHDSHEPTHGSTPEEAVARLWLALNKK